MQLKKYQNETLAVIKAFFDALDTKSPTEAYESVTSSADMIARLGKLRGYSELGGSSFRSTETAADEQKLVPPKLDIPVVSIKVQTGGGKTIIAAHAVKVIAECQGREYPFILWFAPSETIRRQPPGGVRRGSR